MLDDYTKRGMVLRTALRLAEEKGWNKLTLTEIASDAGVTLADIHKDFGSRTGILTAFIDEVDKAVLKKTPPADQSTPARDRVFDVLMARFETLGPYKGALKRIYSDCRRAAPGMSSARLCCASLNSMNWMLNAAGVPASGSRGCVRLAGIACVYSRAACVWLDDDSPDMAKTMAKLDRELQSGERWLKRADALCAELVSIAGSLVPRRRPSATDGEQPSAG